jgi:lipopolysaccharide/colanic/teichoic acid biosynthesis glycosyltransferase
MMSAVTAGERRVAYREGLTSSPSLTAQAVRALVAFLILCCDAISVLFGFAIADLAYHQTASVSQDALPGVGVLVLYTVFAIYSAAYSHDSLSRLKTSVERSVKALVLAVTATLFLAFWVKSSEEISRLIFLVGSVGALATMVMLRIVVGSFIKRSVGHRLMKRVLIRDGVSAPAPEGWHVVDAEVAGMLPSIDDPMMLHFIGVALHGSDRVVVACEPERRAAWASVMKGSGLNAEILLPELADLNPLTRTKVGNVSAIPVSTGPLDMRNRICKRVFDIVVTAPALILLAPLLMVVALAIKLESPGRVFFVQVRMGRGNRLFNVYKFRSMRADLCDHAGNRSAARDDDRITAVGRFIRATSIDELPQLINVLLGDMSLVGPRPHALGSLAGDRLFWEVDHRYWHRHATKPGITGLAQVRGFRGATHEREDLANRLQADLEYLSGWSIWRDLGILLATLKVVKHKNAF